MGVLSEIFEHKIVAIVRGANPDDVLKIARALFDGGIRLMEVTMNSDNAIEVIRQLRMSMNENMLIGAGTVLDGASAKKVIDAGAQFIISPSFIEEVVKATKQLEVVSIPGAYTATEIVNAYNNGGDIIKVFPAASNFNYIRDIRAPLPHIPLMPTGGISLENIKAFQSAGAVAFGIGTALVDTKKEITEDYLMQLSKTAKQFVQAIAQ
jgi:2-dehydro-3-deoxyphosphogluconate aldolase / (4S)-4-hydroxy-2-oxoglutarate aldolase